MLYTAGWCKYSFLAASVQLTFMYVDVQCQHVHVAKHYKFDSLGRKFFLAISCMLVELVVFLNYIFSCLNGDGITLCFRPFLITGGNFIWACNCIIYQQTNPACIRQWKFRSYLDLWTKPWLIYELLNLWYMICMPRVYNHVFV